MQGIVTIVLGIINFTVHITIFILKTDVPRAEVSILHTNKLWTISNNKHCRISLNYCYSRERGCLMLIQARCLSVWFIQYSISCITSNLRLEENVVCLDVKNGEDHCGFSTFSLLSLLRLVSNALNVAMTTRAILCPLRCSLKSFHAHVVFFCKYQSSGMSR